MEHFNRKYLQNLLEIKRIRICLSKWKSEYNREMIIIGACCGSYDGNIHEGHRHFLNTAKKYCDILYIFVVPDYVIKRNKGRDPVFTQSERLQNLFKLKIADYFINLNGMDEDHLKQIIDIKPHIYFFSNDQKTNWDIKLEKKLKELKTRIKHVQRYKPNEFSTTKLHFSNIKRS